jgi:hypothetical protein
MASSACLDAARAVEREPGTEKRDGGAGERCVVDGWGAGGSGRQEAAEEEVSKEAESAEGRGDSEEEEEEEEEVEDRMSACTLVSQVTRACALSLARARGGV